PQRAAHRVLAAGAGAGTEVAGVVEVGTVGDPGEAEPAGQLGDAPELLAPAEVAAVRLVGGVARIFELVGLDRDVAGADPLGQLDRLAQLGPGVALRERG